MKLWILRKVNYICARFQLVIVVLLVSLIAIIGLSAHLPDPDDEIQDKKQYTSVSERFPNHKTILVWDPDVYKYISDLIPPGSVFFNEHCAVKTCYITNDRHTMQQSDFDSVILYWPQREPPPTRRKPHQAYVMFTGEPNDFDLSDKTILNGFYNYTMTFREDSDFYRPFGYVKALPSAPKDSQELQKLISSTGRQKTVNYTQGKTKLAAWFVSHCGTHSRREFLVQHLQMYLPIDIYGRCGNLSCPMEDFKCYEMVERTYKFYFSFENAFCRNYTTEKFFNILAYNVVPVVYGGADYAKLAPPHSYIDATQMTVKQLVQLLKALDADDAMYNKYFWWKPHYQVVYKRRVLDIKMLCGLCEKLHDQDVQQIGQVYQDFNGWWGEKNHCHQFTTLRLPIKEFSFYDVKIAKPVKIQL